MKDLTKANEDYLEAILLLEKEEEKSIKSILVAKTLKVSKPAVNKAMNELKSLGLIEKDAYGSITLTELGRKKAKEVYNKHLIIYNFLITLGLDEETAELDCCKIEHIISDKTLNCFKSFLQTKSSNKH